MNDRILQNVSQHKKDICLAIVAGFFAGVFSFLPIVIIMDGWPFFVLVLAVATIFLLPLLGVIVAFRLAGVPALNQFVKFGIVGGLNTFFELTVVNALILAIGVATGFHFVVFKTISFLLASVNGYAWNKYWTFGSGAPLSAKEYAKFVIANMVGLVLNVGTASLLVNGIGAPMLFSDIVWANISVVAAVFVGMFWNFLSQKFIIFKK